MTYANIRPENTFELYDMLIDIQHVLVFNLIEPFFLDPLHLEFGRIKKLVH